MNALKETTREIGPSIQNSSLKLESLKSQAQQAANGHVVQIRDTLFEIDQGIEHIISEVEWFLDLIKDGDSGSISLNPQIKWLGRKLSSINNNLQRTQTLTVASFEYARIGVYSVSDIGQEVKTNRNQLDVTHTDAESLTSGLESRLRENEQAIRQIQSYIRDIEDEIRTKTTEASEIEARKQAMESDMSQKQSSLSEAERKIKKKRKNAAWSVGASLVGVVSVPLTGVLGAGVANIAGEVSENLVAKISELEVRITALKSEIQEQKSKIDNTKEWLREILQEKDRLKLRVDRYRSDIDDHNSAQAGYQSQLQELVQIQGDVAVFKERNTLTTQNTQDLDKSFRKVKVHFDTCRELLNLWSGELPNPSVFVSRLARRRNQRAREYQRQNRVLDNILIILAKIRMDLPAVLPGREIELLEFVYLDSGSRSDIHLGEGIPPVALRNQEE
ncbi:hypothetical protein P154DRAFT_574151 [Amniculicola lignicola CBS 123094]|uniref:Uncharacterized protein n=1 Tax=Amniculicola lignicola CBS 123094 TaxID=1392246 RepID=A0A6A5WPU1_9PLEO|nr:hypothetical protein P154DRAFT_574151 [Amniculicola lignicola CBS 123094]